MTLDLDFFIALIVLDIYRSKLFWPNFSVLAVLPGSFDVRFTPELTCDRTGQPVVEWIENVDLVCKLCLIERIERVLPLHLKEVELRVLSKGQKVLTLRSNAPC